MNPVKLIAEYLEHALPDSGDSGDTLDERVAMDRLPRDWKNDTSAVMVRQQSGAETATAPNADRWTIAMHCFGGTADMTDAWATYARVAQAMRDPSWSGTEGEIRDAMHVSASGYNEPDTGWPVVLALYEVRTVKGD